VQPESIVIYCLVPVKLHFPPLLKVNAPVPVIVILLPLFIVCVVAKLQLSAQFKAQLPEPP